MAYISWFGVCFDFQVDLISSEKEDLVAALETSKSMVKQIEAQIQDLQKRSDRLDRDLVAEKAMKEQKIKVVTMTMIYVSLPNICHLYIVCLKCQRKFVEARSAIN